MSKDQRPLDLLVDGHVHLWGGDDPMAFLAAAARGLGRGAEHIGTERWMGVLVLAETRGLNRFAEVREMAEQGAQLDGWLLRTTLESESVVASSPTGTRIALVAGRQVVTEESLEVLALACREPISDGETLPETLGRIERAGGVVVIPWAFGKWMGRRGRIVRRAVVSARPGDLLLGDNGNRPRRFGEPAIFALGRDRGIPVLAGTDPLPISSQRERVGSYGSLLGGIDFDPDRPAQVLRSRLRSLEASPPTFGRRLGVGRFLLDQLGLRLARGKGSRTGVPDATA